nr:MAG TPA: hypothetical protein [Bacteriophage sp.]
MYKFYVYDSITSLCLQSKYLTLYAKAKEENS